MEVTTDKAAVYPHVLDELAPSAWHCTQAYANNRMEADHEQLKRRLRPMRSLKTDQSARITIAGHAFLQNIRRGHYELGVDEPVTLRVVAAFDELLLAIAARCAAWTAAANQQLALAASQVASVHSRRIVFVDPGLTAANGRGLSVLRARRRRGALAGLRGGASSL